MLDLVTVEETMEYLRVDYAPNTPGYKLIQGLVTRASAWARRYCDRPLVNETITETLSGNGDKEIFLKYWPVVSVASVLVDGAPVTDCSWEDIGALFREDGWPIGRKNITVTYTAGFGATTADIPQEIRQAVFTVIKAWYRRDIQDFSVTEGAGEYAYLPPETSGLAKELLRPYRRNSFGAA